MLINFLRLLFLNFYIHLNFNFLINNHLHLQKNDEFAFNLIKIDLLFVVLFI